MKASADGRISVHYQNESGSPTYKIDLNNDQITNISGMINTYYQWERSFFFFAICRSGNWCNENRDL
ncbi:MAG: hypothetical protein KTV77_03435 [Wolbachia endosymbiont of Fragariocoptes setiger]|nr:hypothetical protein [Wolbachia endosymbiont of Fragariocoptes setiger]